MFNYPLLIIFIDVCLGRGSIRKNAGNTNKWRGTRKSWRRTLPWQLLLLKKEIASYRYSTSSFLNVYTYMKGFEWENSLSPEQKIWSCSSKSVIRCIAYFRRFSMMIKSCSSRQNNLSKWTYPVFSRYPSYITSRLCVISAFTNIVRTKCVLLLNALQFVS